MRGIQDKCDILTLSLGGNGGWVANSPSEILIDSVAAQGIVVTVAAGNSGSEGSSLPSFSSSESSLTDGCATGTFFAQEPASTIKQISVASTDNLFVFIWHRTRILADLTPQQRIHRLLRHDRR